MSGLHAHHTNHFGTRPLPTWQQLYSFRCPLYAFFSLRAGTSHSSSRLSIVTAQGGGRAGRAGQAACTGLRRGGAACLPPHAQQLPAGAGPKRRAAPARAPVSRNRPLGANRSEASAGLYRSVRLATQRPVSADHTRLRRGHGRQAATAWRAAMTAGARQLHRHPSLPCPHHPATTRTHSRQAIKGAGRNLLARRRVAAQVHAADGVRMARDALDDLAPPHIPHHQHLVKAAADLRWEGRRGRQGGREGMGAADTSGVRLPPRRSARAPAGLSLQTRRRPWRSDCAPAACACRRRWRPPTHTVCSRQTRWRGRRRRGTTPGLCGTSMAGYQVTRRLQELLQSCPALWPVLCIT